MPDAYKSFTVSVRCALTTDDRLRIGSEMADAAAHIEQLEDDLKELKESYKARTTAAEAVISRCQRALRNNYQMGDRLCQWQLDAPTPGMKSLIRLDTFEPIETTRMEERDMQTSLPFDDPVPTEEPEPKATAQPDQEQSADAFAEPQSELVFDREIRGRNHHAQVKIVHDPTGPFFAYSWSVRLGSSKQPALRVADEQAPFATLGLATRAAMDAVLTEVRAWLAQRSGEEACATLMSPVSNWANEQLNLLDALDRKTA